MYEFWHPTPIYRSTLPLTQEYGFPIMVESTTVQGKLSSSVSHYFLKTTIMKRKLQKHYPRLDGLP